MSLPSSQLEIVHKKCSYETLYKELQRKDKRNDSLAIELKDARTKRDEMQRELHLLGAVFEKVNRDKANLEQELKKVKTEKTRATSSDGIGTSLKKLEYAVHLKDRRVSELEKEVSIYRRSKEMKDLSQTEVDVSGSESVIESLCDEVGKHKSQAHGLALTLAEVHRDLMSTKSEVMKSKEINTDFSDKIRELSQECERLTVLKTNQMNEILALHKRVMTEADVSSRLSKQIEDLSSRLTEERAVSDVTIAQLRERNKDLETEHEISSREKLSTQSRLLELESTLKSVQSVHQLSEDLLHRERTLTESLQTSLQDRENEVLGLEESVVSLHGRLQQTLSDLNDMKALVDSYAKDRCEWDSLRDKHRESMSALINDLDDMRSQRDEGLHALRETVGAVRELSAKASAEGEARTRAEQELAVLREEMHRAMKSKAQVTSAVLDALSKEKARVVTLERALDEALPGGAAEYSSREVDFEVMGAKASRRGGSDSGSISTPTRSPPSVYSDAYDTYSVGSSNGKSSATPLSAVEQLQLLRDELRKLESTLPYATPSSEARNGASAVTQEQEEDHGPLIDQIVGDKPLPPSVERVSLTNEHKKRKDDDGISLFDIVDADIYE